MASTTIEAADSKINGTGFQVREQDGWVNISKYAKPADVATPPVGAKVKITLDGSNFARNRIARGPQRRAAQRGAYVEHG